ncbi:MAG: LysM peptidoglycan-binding domain-containing protein [Termitinemataceae bacterium]|nr:MAG: LysM peptidoglycan-binding domain-containing protein [Termitinemataceae bacterium]
MPVFSVKKILFSFVMFVTSFFAAAQSEQFERALRQNKTVLPARLVEQQEDRKRGITMPTLNGFDESLTKYFIERYSKPAGLKWLISVLKDGSPYLAFIREEVAARNMPPELLYLPVIESGFSAKAHSSSGAAGFWQFMRNSIKPYMVIDDWKDERLDFWKATHAALSKLQSNYKDYSDWQLALAAYNSGSGAVNNVLKQTGIHNYWQLAAGKKLKSESINYVPKLIAIYYIASNPRKFGLDILSTPEEHLWTRVQVDNQINLSMLAEYAGIDYVMLHSANSELKFNLTPPNGHLLKVEVPYANAVQDVLNNPDLKLLKYHTHIVQTGNTLSAIAQHYGVSVEQIVKQNPGLKPDNLSLGQQIVIPAIQKPSTTEVSPAPSLQNYNWNGTWTVQKGDTLWSIAKSHNVKPDDLAAANGMTMTETLSIGKVLKVPK